MTNGKRGRGSPYLLKCKVNLVHIRHFGFAMRVSYSFPNGTPLGKELFDLDCRKIETEYLYSCEIDPSEINIEWLLANGYDPDFESIDKLLVVIGGRAWPHCLLSQTRRSLCHAELDMYLTT